MLDVNWLRPLRGGACVIGALIGASVAGARQEAATPFGLFAGDWDGSDKIVAAHGSREPIRCRASDSESEGGVALSQSIVCASPGCRVDIESNIEASGQNVSGNSRGDTRHVSGELGGTIESGRFEGAVTGPGFTASVSLRSNGRRQSVRITPRGADIADVSIELVRKG